VALREVLLQRVPMQRFGSAEEMVNPTLFGFRKSFLYYEN
jgi:hypothetical protein